MKTKTFLTIVINVILILNLSLFAQDKTGNLITNQNIEELPGNGKQKIASKKPLQNHVSTARTNRLRNQNSRLAKPANGSQICTGCCDPCYSDDGWKIKHQNAAARHKAKVPSHRKNNSQ